MNSELYAADAKAREEKMALSEGEGFAYINASGRVQYAFAPHSIYDQGTGEVAFIIANASDRLDELDLIKIHLLDTHYIQHYECY